MRQQVGFFRDDADDAFQSPVESENDDVDSDFDRAEDEEDEPEPKLGASGEAKRALLQKNKKWVMARMGCLMAPANTVTPETQVSYPVCLTFFTVLPKLL
ncbi:unnamed protein product [Gongylonema pulchrum]|uniref:SPT6_acidic domain-containing protein n=1 Tax=Gongylonema pulchrum TaxID=637853 RepID=A0A183DBE4_9BILA|nr:unnamed protein product [Gongylonema pulchrum]